MPIFKKPRPLVERLDPPLKDLVRRADALLGLKCWYFMEKLNRGDDIATACSSWNVILDTYLVSCHLYYEMDAPLLTDEAFDKLVQFIMKHHREVRQIAVYAVVLPSDFKPAVSHSIIIPEAIKRVARYLNGDSN